MKKRPSYDNTLPDSPLQRRRYEIYTRTLCALWARRISAQLEFSSVETLAAVRATSRLATRAARDGGAPEPATSTQADDVANVVYRFVTDVTPYQCQPIPGPFERSSTTAGASIRAMHDDPRYSRVIVAALAGLFRPGILPSRAQHAA